MVLKTNKLVLYFIVVCFIAMILPYLWSFGSRDLFLKDFYAKRIMTLAAFPFFILICVLSIRNRITRLNKYILLYILLFVIITVNSILYRNKISLIALDAFVVLLPIFFYLLVFKIGLSIKDYSSNFWVFLFIACFLVVLDVKLQFSYFSMLGIVYIIFLTKINFKSAFLFLFTPAIVINTLIGKSSLLLLGFMMIYFFLFDRRLVSKQKKLYLAIIPSILITLSLIVFWDTIRETGAYRNTLYFFKHADFKNFRFTDMSTGHRVYEAQRVLEEFKISNVYNNLFGNGFGATIDLSDTMDVAVTNNNEDLTSVRHIHMGVFAVLHRFGLMGIVIYLGFIFKAIKSCRIVLKNTNDFAFTLSALYVIIIIFDSFISFPHMMSNFMFWLIVFMIFLKKNEIRLKEAQ